MMHTYLIATGLVLSLLGCEPPGDREAEIKRLRGEICRLSSEKSELAKTLKSVRARAKNELESARKKNNRLAKKVARQAKENELLEIEARELRDRLTEASRKPPGEQSARLLLEFLQHLDSLIRQNAGITPELADCLAVLTGDALLSWSRRNPIRLAYCRKAIAWSDSITATFRARAKRQLAAIDDAVATSPQGLATALRGMSDADKAVIKGRYLGTEVCWTGTVTRVGGIFSPNRLQMDCGGATVEVRLTARDRSGVCVGQKLRIKGRIAEIRGELSWFSVELEDCVRK